MGVPGPLGAGRGTNWFRLQVCIKLSIHHKATAGPPRGFTANGRASRPANGWAGRSRAPE